MTRKAGGGRRIVCLFITLLTTVLFLGIISACGADGGNAASSGGQGASSPQAGQSRPAQGAQSLTPTPAVQSTGLQGPANFLLNIPLNFASVNGATVDDNQKVTQLDANTIKTEITREIKRLLFVVDSSNRVKVYSPGVSPVTAQIGSSPDGGTTIYYTQTVTSEAGSVAITFQGALLKDQISVRYQQQFTPSILINANPSDVEVTFTTRVRWVTANQIPAAPKNGTFQLTSDGGIALSWSAGQNAASYDVYRLISDHDQQFQLLATVKGTSYVDDSAEAKQNIHSTKGITYTVFAVGPTGVENPGGIVISITA